MNRVKKFLCICLSAVFVCGLFAAPDVSAAVPDGWIGDDFESYAAADSTADLQMPDSGAVLTGTQWAAYPGAMGFAPAQAGIFNMPSGNWQGLSGKVLAIEAKTANNAYSMFPTMVWNGEYPDTDGYRINVRIATEYGTGGAGGGVRFAADDDFRNFYELYLNAKSENGLRPTVYLNKYVNGERQQLCEISQNNEITGSIQQIAPWGYVYDVSISFFDGVIDFYVDGVKNKHGNYSKMTEHKVITDSVNPLRGGKVALFAAGQGGVFPKFDNFALQGYRGLWSEDTEPEDQIYAVLGAGKIADSDGVIDIGDLSRIRKITSANSGVTVKVSNDKMEWIEIGTANGGLLLNALYEDEYRYVKFEGGTGSIYNNIDSVGLTRPVNSETPLAAHFGKSDQSADAVTWESSDESVFKVESGILKALSPGEGTLTAAYGGKTIKFPVCVEKELDYYRRRNLEDVYLSNKQSITDAFNTAVRENNASVIESMLSRGTELSFDNFSDVDFTAIERLTEVQRSAVAQALTEYEPLYAAGEALTFENVNTLFQYIEREISVYDLAGLTETEEIKAVLEKNYEFYRIDIIDETFVENEENFCRQLAGKNYVSLKELQEYYKEIYRAIKDGYIMETLEELTNYKAVNDFLMKFADDIGYDTAKYEAVNNKNAFMKSFVTAKSYFSGIEDIRKYVDGYKETSGGGGSGGSSGRSSGGSSGGAARATNTIVVPPTDLNAPKPEPVSPFTDLPKAHWGFESMIFLNARSIMTGDESGLMRPDDSVSRAEFIKMLLVALGIETDSELSEDGEENSPAFDDINKSDWFYPYMQKAADAEILLGDGRNCRPNSDLPRQELCTLLCRGLESMGIELNDTTDAVLFGDAAEIESWASHAVMKLQSAGIVSGTPDKRFEPLRCATRAETAKILSEIINLRESLTE